MSHLFPPPALILLSMVISVLIPGVADRLHDRKVAITQIKEVGGTMGIQYWQPNWLRQLVNDDDCFCNPYLIALGPTAGNEAELDDKILASVADTLCSFENLDTLDLRDSELTDQSAEILSRLKRVSTLRLSDTRVSDQTVKQLVKLRKLRRLTLDGTDITDNCVDDLSKLKNLTSLNVVNTLLTKESVVKLSRALPKCKIAF